MIPKLQLPKIDIRDIDWPRFDFSGITWASMPKLRIGDSVARIPIIQGGMGVGISLSGLASAVSNEGGIGVIAANSIGMLDPDYYSKHRDANAIVLRKEIRKAKEKTSGIIGVNIMVAVNDFDDLLWVAMEENADIVFLGAGLPLKGIPVRELRAAGVKVVPIVSSARAAGLIFKSWIKRYEDIPDGVVLEGPKAGGHLGFKAEQIDDPDFALERILPGVVKEIKEYENLFHRIIPVIAAGGVYTGMDIYNLLKLGASGVQMGTRFVATHECDADIRFKEAYVSCKEGDLEIIKSPVGMPGRAIKSKFLDEVSSGDRKSIKCAWRCLRSCDTKNARYCISLALDNARKGILEGGFVFAGSNAFRVDKIVSVKELLQELKKQYLSVEEEETKTLKNDYERAIEKLISLKEDYTTTLKNALRILKEGYEIDFDKRAASFRDDYVKILDRIMALKEEYSNAFERADILKEEIMKFFERYSGPNSFHNKATSPA